MSSSIVWIFSGIQVSAFLVGLATNGFILGVNVMDLMLSVPLTKSDFYMCYLAATNLSLQIWTLAKWICSLAQEDGFFCRLMNALKVTSSSCSLLLTAALCMFYCSRIVVFKHCLFRWVQKHVTHNYRYPIFGSILLCVVMGLPLAWTRSDYDNTQCNKLSAPCNRSINAYSYQNIYRSIIILIGYSIPLFYVVLAAGLILRSLIHHMRRMQVSMRMGHEIRLTAHLQAGCSVLSLLVLFIVYFVLSVLLLTELPPKDSPLLYVCYCAPMLYSAAHSLVMIKGNVKLRSVAGDLLQKCKK
ncbi:taste receptor type 2 member 119-like [Engystomops pustulosus]|uniref:taste receptor type 2 member 119-like n=1 Tax=Engystomops pustulosus TaxID=76066 RepID=UPI003AFA3C02